MNYYELIINRAGCVCFPPLMPGKTDELAILKSLLAQEQAENKALRSAVKSLRIAVEELQAVIREKIHGP